MGRDLAVRIGVSAINTRDTLVARACAGADREIDPVGVAAHRRRCAGKPVILRQEECLPGLDRRPYRRLAPLLRVHREIMDRRLIAQACIEAQQISVEEAQNLTEQREISLFRSEEHTSELQSHLNLVCRLLLEKKKKSHC